jgi:hypothetical protein
VRRIAALLLCPGLLAGCAAPKPFLLDGDWKSAEVGYAMDPAATLRIAKLHCAEYERIPRLLQAQANIAYYECIRP